MIKQLILGASALALIGCETFYTPVPSVPPDTEQPTTPEARQHEMNKLLLQTGGAIVMILVLKFIGVMDDLLDNDETNLHEYNQITLQSGMPSLNSYNGDRHGNE